MIYHFLVPLSAQIGALNVFRYITFRSIYALLTALLITIVLGPMMMRWLNRIKCGQYIQEGVHDQNQCKAGTPTMGGLLLGFGVLVSTLLWADLTNIYVWLTMLVFTGFGIVGFVDDYTKIKRKENKGISARAKLLGQLIVAGTAVGLLIMQPAYSTELAVPFFKNFTPDLGWMYLPFALLVMIGASNGVNLTDGLDGLAIGPSITSATCYAFFYLYCRSCGNGQLPERSSCSGRWRSYCFLRRAGWGRTWLSLVQRLSGSDIYGRRWLLKHRRCIRFCCSSVQTGTAAHHCWWSLCFRNRFRDHAGKLFQSQRR